MSEPLDPLTAPLSGSPGLDFLTADDLRGSAREDPAEVIFRGPGTLMGNTRSQRMAGDAAVANGVTTAPTPNWFQLAWWKLNQHWYLLLFPVNEGSTDAVAGSQKDYSLVITGLHDFFRRNQVNMNSREGRRCKVLGIRAMGAHGHCLVIDWTGGTPVTWEDDGAAAQPRVEPAAAAQAAATAAAQVAAAGTQAD